MRLKKILISAASIIALSSPLIALAFVNSFPKELKSDKRYTIQDSVTEQAKKDIKEALDNTIGNSTLPLKFYTLTNTSQYTPSKLAWFSELHEAMKALDPRIDFQIIPRSSQTVESGFRQKNGEMVSMFWSPDYHNIGTWVGFWFYDDYVSPNLWPSLYNFLSQGTDPESKKPWAQNLKTFIESKKLYPKDNQPPYVLNNSYFQSYDELTKIDSLNYQNHESTSFRKKISDVVAAWADTVSNPNYAVGLVSWMDDQAAMIPWISDGPTTIKKLLVREGFKTPNNDYSAMTYRDWYYDPNADHNSSINERDASKKTFRWWTPTNPFATNKTPYNASFNDSSNNAFFQSTYNGLTDWKIVGDWKLLPDKSWQAPKATLTLGAATKIVLKNNGREIKKFEAGETIDSYKIYDYDNANEITLVRKASEQADEYEFTINPKFPWYSISGKTSKMLTAQDFFWGLMGYLLSCDLSINTNGYFIDLMNLDVVETVKANPDFYEIIDNTITEPYKYYPYNLKPKLNNSQDKIIFKVTPGGVNFLDIITKQYFQPLPIENQTVQNIFDGPSSKKGLYYTISKNGNKYVANFDLSKSNFNNLYGSGANFRNYENWWSAGAYYVSNTTEQDITFVKNDDYFNAFPDGMFGNKNQKIGTVVMKYGGAFSDQLTYTQFSNNEIDRSNIPISLIAEAASKYKPSFRTEGVLSVPKTDLISFNTNVFERDSNKIDFKTSSSNPNAIIVQTLDGQPRVLKSLVSKEYYEAIVKDFGVPNGNSEKIRKGIINGLDWYSLAALAVPDNNPSFQQSVVPFGNFPVDGNSFASDITEPGVSPENVNDYYELADASNKFGLTRRDVFVDSIAWTINSYKNYWLKQFKKN